LEAERNSKMMKDYQVNITDSEKYKYDNFLSLIEFPD